MTAEEKIVEIKEKILEEVMNYSKLDKSKIDERDNTLWEILIDKTISEGMKLGREEYINERLKNPTIFGQPTKYYKDFVRKKARDELIGEIEKEIKEKSELLNPYASETKILAVQSSVDVLKELLEKIKKGEK